MDISTDIWGQLAVEASQVYLSDGTMRSPFADTVDDYPNFHFALNTRSHSIYTHIPICISDHLSLSLSLSDHWEAARQGVAAHLLVSISSRDLSPGSHLSALASDRLRYAPVEECLVAAGGLGTACGLTGDAAIADLCKIWADTALHWAAHRADHAHCVARVVGEVSQSDSHVARFLNG